MTNLTDAVLQMERRGLKAEAQIRLEKPELLSLFNTYQNEAIEARKLINESISTLEVGDSILEVGGGILALSVQLSSEGFEVTTVEPIGEGFNELDYVLKLFLEIAKKEELEFTFIKLPIEDTNFDDKFDLIFSINVMEHLKDPYLVLKNLIQFLKPRGTYHFFCPNYDFPYEPHFGKILFARKNKAFYLKSSFVEGGFLHNKEMEGLYHSLNFITLRKVKMCLEESEFRIKVNCEVLYELTLRAFNDVYLAKRHPRLFLVVRFARYFHILKILKFWPANFQPVMDLKIQRK
jgi:2-polyprenyl-3-methyl-5-hydroxy-6-metoxy-1,4-benzoquinol methylase